jgi:hypothetical protein
MDRNLDAVHVPQAMSQIITKDGSILGVASRIAALHHKETSARHTLPSTKNYLRE